MQIIKSYQQSGRDFWKIFEGNSAPRSQSRAKSVRILSKRYRQLEKLGLGLFANETIN